jgi:DNA-binding MarR family transcriptional regulator
MSLKNELKFKNPIKRLSHEALLNIYFTASCIKKQAGQFFGQYGLTDVQFNVLSLIAHQSGKTKGLTQAQLSDMMLVNRANITTLIDRMEKAKLVKRTANPDDRRYNIIKLTDRGEKLLKKVEPLYTKQVETVMAPLTTADQKKIVTMLEKVRGNITV